MSSEEKKITVSDIPRSTVESSIKDSDKCGDPHGVPSVNDSKHSLRSESPQKTKPKGRPRSKPGKPTSQSGSCAGFSRSLRGSSSCPTQKREARLDKHQQQKPQCLSAERKPSPVPASAASVVSSGKERQEKKEDAVNPPSSSKKKWEGKSEGKELPTHTSSLSPRPGKGGEPSHQEKEAPRSKDVGHRSSSTSPKPSDHHSKSGKPSSSSRHTSPVSNKDRGEHLSLPHKVNTKSNKDEHKKPSSSSQHVSEVKKEVPQPSSSSPKPSHRSDKDKKSSSGQHVSEVRKEVPRPSSSSPKPSHRSDKDKKSSSGSRNVSPVPRREGSGAHSTSPRPDTRRDSKHSKSSSASHKVSSTPKQLSHTSLSPKPEAKTKDLHGTTSSDQKSSSLPKEHSHVPSSSGKPEQRRSYKPSKSCPSSRNVSPVTKESSHTSSTSPKPDQRKNEKDISPKPDQRRSGKDRASGSKEKSRTPSISPNPSDGHSSGKHNSRMTSPVSVKDTVRSSATSPSPKDHRGHVHKSGSQLASVSREATDSKQDSKHKMTCAKSRETSPAQQKKSGPESGSSKVNKTGSENLMTGVNNQSESKDHKNQAHSSQYKTEKESGGGRSSQQTRSTSSRTKSSKNSSPSPPKRSTEKEGRGTTKEHQNPDFEHLVEKRPAFEHQVSLGFSQEEMGVKNSSRSSPSRESIHQKLSLKVNEPKANGPAQLTAKQTSHDGKGVCTESEGGRKGEQLQVQEMQRSRSCTSSPQPAGSIHCSHFSSASSSPSPSLLSARDCAHHKDSPVPAEKCNQTAAETKVKYEPPKSISAYSKENAMKDVVTASLSHGEPESGSVEEVPRDEKASVLTCLGTDRSSKEDRSTTKSSGSSTLTTRETTSPTKTVMVSLKDIALSLRENGSSFVDIPSKVAGPSTSNDCVQKVHTLPHSPTVWRGPRTPPGSPSPSLASSCGSRRNSRVSSSSSCSSRSSTSSSLSSSTSRGHSTSSTRSAPNKQKSPRKNRANARRRSLRSYSASSTTSTTTTTSSSEEEMEVTSSTKPNSAGDGSAAKLDPAPPPAISPLFGPLRAPEKSEKRAREEASLPSESSPCSSLSSVTNPPSVSPLFGALKEPERKLREELAVSESSPGSTPSSTASPSVVEWQKDSHKDRGTSHEEGMLGSSAVSCGGTSHPKLSPAAAGPGGSSGKSEQLAGGGTYPASSSLNQQSMTHISSSLPLPDLTKPPPTLYCGLTGYPPPPSMVSSYPSPPVPAPRPGYLPLGSPPPVVTVSPGYVSHSPNTPSHNHQPAAKFSQLRNHNNNNVGPWGVGTHMGAPPPPPSPYSPNAPGSDKPGARTSHLYPSATPSVPVQQQSLAYPTNHSYWATNYKYHNTPMAGRAALDNSATRPSRLYTSSSNHAHSWHPYSGGPPLASSAMRRQ